MNGDVGRTRCDQVDDQPHRRRRAQADFTADGRREHQTGPYGPGRGVDVRILVAGFSDSELLLNASRAYYSDLLEAGIKVFESQEHIMHAKTMVVDGYWSTVGSSNT